MGLFDRVTDKEKLQKITVANPRETLNEILKRTSGSSYVRDVKFNIFYQTYGFVGVSEGVGCSTIVANTAIAIAKAGLTVCVIDTSILRPVQDVLLNTDESVYSEDDGKEHLDWFDMPYTRKSTLHVSKIDKNISVLSFKGKKRGIVDAVGTTDSPTLVEMALTELHNKFDIILLDICSELTEISAACLQMAQQVIQVWNDSPLVLANLENFIINAMTLSCPMDKMRFVVLNKLCRDAMGNLDELVRQYKVNKLATSYISQELTLLTVTGKTLFQYASSDKSVIAYTDCILDIAAHILNIPRADEKTGTITSQDITDGKVDGTLHKKLKEEEEQSVQVVTFDADGNDDSAFDFSFEDDDEGI